MVYSSFTRHTHFLNCWRVWSIRGHLRLPLGCHWLKISILHVEEFQQLRIRVLRLTVIATLHLFQPRNFLHFQFCLNGEERFNSQWSDSSIALTCLCCLQVLYSFLSSLLFLTFMMGAWRMLWTCSCMVGNARAIETIPETLTGFSITFCCLCQPLHYVHARSTLSASHKYVSFSTSPKCSSSWMETWNWSQ